MRTSIIYIAFLVLGLCFLETIVVAQNLQLEVYNSDGNLIGTLKIWEMQGTKYVLLDDVSKIFGGARKNEPLFGRTTIVLSDKKIIVTNDRNRIKVNDEEQVLSKSAIFISGKLAVPLDFLTKVIARVINKRIILDQVSQILEITSDPYGSQGVYRSKTPKLRVMIDPGHGGYDIGAKSKTGLIEKELSLEIAMKVNNLLKDKEDIEVFLTRSDDKYMTIDERIRFANNLRGSLFLSIHFNASSSENAKGFCLCVNNERMRLGANSSQPSNSSAFYMQSRKFVGEIKSSLGSAITTGGRDREASISVLNGLFMPGVMLEILYLTNQDDLNILAKPDFTNLIAKAISDAILKYSRSITGLSSNE